MSKNNETITEIAYSERVNLASMINEIEQENDGTLPMRLRGLYDTLDALDDIHLCAQTAEEAVADGCAFQPAISEGEISVRESWQELLDYFGEQADGAKREIINAANIVLVVAKALKAEESQQQSAAALDTAISHLISAISGVQPVYDLSTNLDVTAMAD